MKAVVLKICILCLAQAVSFGVSECILRFLHPFTPEYLKKAPYSFSCYEPGSYYWLRYKKNSSCTLRSTIGAFSDVEIRLNSLGLRNTEIQIPKPPNKKRILFIGDSFITGWGVPDHDALPQMTATVMQNSAEGRDIETINAGLSASGQGYEYVFLKHDGVLIDPDVIIVGLYIHNDIADSLRESVWEGIDVSGLPDTIGSMGSYVDFQGNVRRDTNSIKMAIPFLRTSYLYDLITDGIVDLFPKQFSGEGLVNLSCVYSSTCHTYDSQKNTMKKLLHGMYELAMLHDKTFVVVLIPSELQVHPEHSKRYSIGRMLTVEDVTAPQKDFIEYFQKEKIPYIDLLPVFQQHASENLYYTLDEHWTNEGNLLAAEQIAQYLTRSPIRK